MENKKKVFICYDSENGKHYKNLLLAWDANKQFDFYFLDYEEEVSINNTNSASLKSKISSLINQESLFLVIIGKNTHKSIWVKWEINKAIELGKKIIAVKTEKENISPNELLRVGASWAMSFTYSAISKAINNV